jgi:hypothetical protein
MFFSRWKVFQCLDIEAENLGEGALRQVGPFLLEKTEWESFLAKHSAVDQMVPESNEVKRVHGVHLRGGMGVLSG